MADGLEMKTKDLSQEKIRMIGKLFPNCITESKIEGKLILSVDFDALRQELSDHVVEGPQERYQFTWPDKSKSKRLANTPTTMTLRPCREESVNYDHTKNLYIEGDNLEVLKILRETYLGKVKMIYIDPPYNTGNDFIYNDDFSTSADEYLEKSGDFDDSGNRLFLNTSSNGRFHTDWLNMIYPRLLLSKDLLTNDGIICIQIDDNEQSNLHAVCNEIFGEQNHLATICIKMSHLSGMKMSHKDKKVPKIKEFILIYGKNVKNTSINPIYVKGKWKDVLDRYNNFLFKPSPDVETWYKLSLSEVIKKQQIVDEDTFKIQHADQIFRTAVNDSVSNYPKDGKFYKVITKTGMEKIVHNSEEVIFASSKMHIVDGELVPAEVIGDIWTDIGINNLHNEGDVQFQNGKKPLKLVKRLLGMFTSGSDIVLDYFSGSSTTAHAVMQLNKEDLGSRNFIMIQLPENSNDDKHKTICEIGKERLRRAGKKLIEQSTLDSKKLDVGFRVLKLDSSNMRDVYYYPNQISRSSLDDYAGVIKSDRTSEDLLIQVMLELGIELSVSIDKVEVEGNLVFNIDNGYLIACFDNSIEDNLATAISKTFTGSAYAVFRSDQSMTDDMLSNIEQIFKTYNPQTKIRIL